MKRNIIIFIYFSCLVANGFAQVNGRLYSNNKSGVLEKVPQFYEIVNNINTPSWGPGLAEKIWYNSRATIKTVKASSSITIDKKTTTTYPVYCYLFYYKPTGMLYEYRHFSDTALPLQKFKASDTFTLVSVDIYHYEDAPGPEREIITQEKLPDTLIENIPYEVKFIHSREATGKSLYLLTFSRCDENMRFLKSYGLDLDRKEKDACPMIKYYIVSSPENRMPLFSQEIVFLTDGLTSEEEKVFAAWEKRAKEDAPIILPQSNNQTHRW